MKAALLRSHRVAAVLALALIAASAATSASAASGAKTHSKVVAVRLMAAASLPASTCTESPAGHRHCNLWARAGTTDLPNHAPGLPVWGFVSNAGDTPGAPGGPTLIVNQGDVVEITMHNDLPGSVNGGNELLSLLLPAAPVLPDTDGVAQGGSTTTTFTASQPGTFIYEAGPTENARHQVAMGLYGPLVVRAPGVAAASLTTAFGSNADLLYTAVASGAGGNDITIAYIDPGAINSPLSVSVTGDAITVSLATNGSSALTSTAGDVRAAVNANPAAAGLVSAALADGSDGSGVVPALAATHLSGGTSPAYGPGTAYDAEALLLLGEIDPALNGSSDPSAFDMKNYKPTYRTINGRTYHDGGSIPSTEPISAVPGDDLLLRYVNAGLDEHSMSLLGMYQTVLATDGHPMRYSYQAVAETVGAGATMDTLAHVPADAADGSMFAVSDQGQHLDLAGAGWATSATASVRAGGMMTFVTTPGTFDPCSGPVPTAGSVSPFSNDGSAPFDVSATFEACTPSGGGPKQVDGVEYFVDTIGADGSGATVPVGSPAGTVAASFSINPSSPLLAAGEHTVYVHAHDDGGSWGGFDAETFFVDQIGPDTLALALKPPAANSAAVKVSGTASDVLNGNQNVTQAEFRLDGTGNPATAMTVSAAAPVSAISGTIPAGTITGLPEGAHTVYVRSRDALGNWGTYATIELDVDRTAPIGSGGSFGPSPNNGTISIDPNSFELQVDADFTDPVASGVQTDIVKAEGFLDVTHANGTGTVYLPTDGAFDSPSENGYIRLPLATINSLAQGPHVFYSHAKDAAGNWGPFVQATMIVDKSGPVVSAVSVAGDVLSGTAADPMVPGTGSGSNLTGAEWFEGADPGPGNGTAMAATDGAFDSPTEAVRATLPAMPDGTHTLHLRAHDAAGNWGPVTDVTFSVGSLALFSNGFAAGNLSGWSSVTGGSAITASTAANLHGVDPYGLQVVQNGTATRFVQDNTPNNEANYSARFYFNPHGAETGTANATILAGRATGGQVVMRLQYHKVSATTYRIRAASQTAVGWATTTAVQISNATHAVELDWHAGTDGYVRLYTDGVLRTSLTGLASSAFRVTDARLGPSATLGAGLTGTIWFDDFTSTRGGTIGP